jgi:hypothetical protein
MSRPVRLSVALEARLDAGWPWHKPTRRCLSRHEVAGSSPAMTAFEAMTAFGAMTVFHRA